MNAGVIWTCVRVSYATKCIECTAFLQEGTDERLKAASFAASICKMAVARHMCTVMLQGWQPVA